MRNKTVIRNIVMLAAGFMAGRVSMAYMTDTVREDESNIIAFVNLDEGVISGDRAVNYAASLIHFPAAICIRRSGICQEWSADGRLCGLYRYTGRLFCRYRKSEYGDVQVKFNI
ncbi:hypothetical protein [Extibacter muris]|uniref:hypothetical protein n=1 Tax=Extibacter muris TaxID=1796622 RepID=UPI0011AE73B0|nr:hypothetical protein [Extibacter muris]MCU0078719.1 hypothetical protein [Extibacter muris]